MEESVRTARARESARGGASGRPKPDSPMNPFRRSTRRQRRHAPSEQDVRWYALWTRSRHEQVVREQLEQKHIESFLPTVTRWSRWKDRKKKIDWPLFPGYCFARFNLRERLPILKCAGVVNIISFEGEPAPIPEHEIDAIRMLIESELAYDPCPMIARA